MRRREGDGRGARRGAERALSGGGHTTRAAEAPGRPHLASGGADQLGLAVHGAGEDQAAVLVGGDTGQRALVTLGP